MHFKSDQILAAQIGLFCRVYAVEYSSKITVFTLNVQQLFFIGSC